MKLPRKMKEILEEEGQEFKKLFWTAYEEIEKLGLTFHPQDSPNVIAEHPKNEINCVAIWFKGGEGNRRIEGEVRVDGYLIDDLSTGMKDNFIIHKYDQGKKPLWWLLPLEGQKDINKLCLIAKRVISQNPNWGVR